MLCFLFKETEAEAEAEMVSIVVEVVISTIILVEVDTTTMEISLVEILAILGITINPHSPIINTLLVKSVANWVMLH